MRTPKLPAASPARALLGEPAVPHADPVLARRLDEHGEDLAVLRIQFLNMQAALSRWPALRRFLRTLPRDLKTLYPNLVPFSAECWSGRPHPRSRAAAAVAYLRAHPGVLAAATAQASAAARSTVRRSRVHRDAGPEPAPAPGPKRRDEKTGATGRAMRYLATHRPRTIADVVRVIGSSTTTLYRSRRFRAAWDCYRQGAGLGDAHWKRRRGR